MRLLHDRHGSVGTWDKGGNLFQENMEEAFK